ncbi:MAG: hypothetical protein AAFN77_05405 [Planctomycetota bacterium]
MTKDSRNPYQSPPSLVEIQTEAEVSRDGGCRPIASENKTRDLGILLSLFGAIMAPFSFFSWISTGFNSEMVVAVVIAAMMILIGVVLLFIAPPKPDRHRSEQTNVVPFAEEVSVGANNAHKWFVQRDCSPADAIGHILPPLCGREVTNDCRRSCV